MASGGPTTPFARLTDAWNSTSMSVRVALAIMVGGAAIAAALAATSSNRSATTPLVPLLGGYDFSLDGRESAIKAFRTANLTGYSIAGGKILVPKDKEADYLAALASGDSGLPGNTDEAIDKYIEEQRSWWASTAESVRLFHVAEQRRLARVIESFPEIDHASVLISQPPERGGIRSRTAQGTAAVKVSTVDGKPLHPQRIDQIKDLIDGAFVDIPGRDSVRVVEDALRSSGVGGGSQGPDPSLLSEGAGQYLMTKAAFECQVENKIRELFADLKGLLVKVNAELDPRHRRTQRIDMKEKGPLKRESSESSNAESASTSSLAAGGEPGVRPNVDIPGRTPNQGATATAAAAPNVQTQETVDREFDNISTLSDQSFVDFEPVKVGIVVRYRTPPAGQGQAGKDAGPAPQQIREMIASLGYPGMTVDSVSVQPYVGEEPPPAPIPSPSLSETAAKWFPSIGYLVVGLSAIVMAIVLARRAPLPQIGTATPSEPSPDASDGKVPDITIPKDEAALKFERLQEQINKMVQSNPEAAAGFVKRWILDQEG